MLVDKVYNTGYVVNVDMLCFEFPGQGGFEGGGGYAGAVGDGGGLGICFGAHG